ncbi:calcium uptake protein 2, mitochondrial isoform X2 [Dendropsophus ebraccatus]|uniref:calcium uptake protein 2, mitochondrial isoform X2 n=1 Tax=Dendropsophus ebraccatus TaxID=150705 RepID=UPI00383125F9
MAAWRTGLPSFARKLVALGGPGIRITSRATRAAGVALAGAGAVYTGLLLVKKSGYRSPGVMRVCAQSEVTVDETQEKQSLRKQRFMHFASLEYDGEYYMTPRDFLFSVMFESLQHKTNARILTKKEFDAMLSRAAKAKPGPKFFRDLGDNGLISYTEYLFLLTILTKPKTGFQIAFEMLDTDDNDQVDKKEFFKLQKILGTKDEIQMDPVQESLTESADINTTLLVYFFGRAGRDKLQYASFYRFIENLQTEIQEMEFAQFSKGLDFMRKEDFAEWLLFFTDEEGNDIYWHNVKTRIPPGESITMEEFKSFYQFMNNLEDFSITMKMFSVANKAVKLAEFKRAVKVATGEELSENVLDTVFKIFDLDGDNCLSHGEFLGVLKNRLHRGLKHVPQQLGLQGYWKCVKRETIKGANEVWKQAGKSPF